MKKIIQYLFMGLLLTATIQSLQARPIGKYKEFSASLPGNFSCAHAADVRIDTSVPGSFGSNRKGLLKVVALVRLALGFECPKLKTINLVGYDQGQSVLQATITESSGWVLKLEESPPKRGVAAPVVASKSTGAKRVGNTKMFIHGDFSIDVTGIRCTSVISPLMTHKRKRTRDYSLQVLQEAVSILAEHVHRNECRRAKFQKMIITGATGVKERFDVSADKYWQLSATSRKYRKAADVYRKAGQNERESARPWTENSPNPLKHRGFYASWLKYSGNDFKLYTVKKSKNTRLVDLVIEHSIPDDQKFIETEVIKTGTTHVTIVANSFLKEIQKAFDSFNLSYVQWMKISHYVKGYEHPKDDRRLVMGPNGVETPLLTHGLNVYWRDRPILMPRGAVIYYGKKGQPGKFLSVAEARQNLGERKVVDNTPRPLSPEGPSQKYLKKQKASRDKAIKVGYVYKNEEYWMSFRRDYVKEIFEGSGTGYHLDSPLIKLFIEGYVTTIQNRCPALVGANPGIFVVTRTTTTFNGYGHVVGRSKAKVGEVHVKRRFVPIYGHYKNVKSDKFTVSQGLRKAFDIATKRGAGSTLDTLKRKAKFVQNVRADLQQLFANEKCDSPVLAQFEENIFRYAAGQKPVQLARVRIPRSSTANDPLYVRGAAKNIAMACMATDDFKFRDSRSRDFCGCVGKRVGNAVTPERAQKIRSRYRAFERDMWEVRRLLSYGEKPKDASLYRTYRSCAR